MMTRGEAVVLRGVALELGTHRFVFDLDIAAGAFVAVTGPSGAGKSTLFNLIAGFETPSQGRVSIGNEDVTDLAPARRPVSLAFQDNNLFAHLDVFTNVALGMAPSLRLSADQREQVRLSLRRVGLEGFERRLPRSLSGGERQRAAFARALVRKRPVMLLDEPFASLDPGLRREMGELLVSLHAEQGFTVLMITHDPAEARRLANRIVFIDDGRIVISAETEAFFQMKAPPALERFVEGAGF